MKTNRFILAALFIFAAVSCQKESFVGSENTRETEAATIVAGEMTKTSLSGNDIHWTSDDVIAVYDNLGYRNEFAIKDAEANYAAFSGEVTSGTTQIYAVYPYQLAGAISGSTVSVTIPVDQTSKAGSFAEEHNISVAKSEKTPGVEAIQNVTFKNVASILKFTVPSYIEDVKSVTFSTSRAIAGAATVDASADAPVAVVAENGSKSVTMTGSYPAGSQFMFVLSAGEINGFTVTVVTEKATWSITRRNTVVKFAPGQYKNLGVLELEQVGVSAAHTYSENTLTGTTVTVALNVPAATQQYASNLKIEVKNAAGTIVRSVSKNSLSASETLAANADWPYLPQGTYTVSGSYKLGSVEKTFSTTFTSPAPTFTVTSNAYTSYTKYTKYSANSINEANNCNAKTIYNVNSATISIADAIMNNSNYTSLKVGVYKLDGSEQTSSNVINQSIGMHTVHVSYTFDNVTKEASKACYITGLPYSFTFYKNEEAFGGEGWTCNGSTGWQSNLFWLSENALGNSYGWVSSPAINAPAEIKTQIELNTKFYASKLFRFNTMTFYLGVTSNPGVSVNAVSGTNTATNSTSSTADVRTFSTTLTIPSGIQYISINHDNTTDTASYFYLYSYSCLYR